MSGLITISFKTRDRRRAHIHFPWEAHKRLRLYLRDPVLRKYALIGQVRRLGLMNQHRRKIRLNSVPEEGDTIFVGRRQ